MKITMTGIKHYPSMSEETNCYEANLHIDDVKVGRVSNQGIGGPAPFVECRKRDSARSAVPPRVPSAPARRLYRPGVIRLSFQDRSFQ